MNEWKERYSEQFLQFGSALIPDIWSLKRIFPDVLAFREEERFAVADICCGGGWLAEMLLFHYPKARVTGLDGSERMIVEARHFLAPYKKRVSFRKMEMTSDDWRSEMNGTDAFVSSLAIHHLDNDGKIKLFRDLYNALNPGGRLVILDLTKPPTEVGRITAARDWDACVKRQSEEIFGDSRAYDFFQHEKWNYYWYPEDPLDQPADLNEQLLWLSEAGFSGVDLHFFRAGHALFSGMKPIEQ